jgi:hypothetical protein
VSKFHVWNIVRNLDTGRIGIVWQVNEGHRYPEPEYTIRYGKHTYGHVDVDGTHNSVPVHFDDKGVDSGTATARNLEFLASTPQEWEETKSQHAPVIKIQIPGHGLFKTYAYRLDLVMAAYLPASAFTLRKKLSEYATENGQAATTYDDLHSVTECLMVLAEFNGYGL